MMLLWRLNGHITDSQLKHRSSASASEVIAACHRPFGDINKCVLNPDMQYTHARYDEAVRNMTVQSPIEQLFTGRNGLFQVINIEKKPMLVSEFERLANSPK